MKTVKTVLLGVVVLLAAVLWSVCGRIIIGPMNTTPPDQSAMVMALLVLVTWPVVGILVAAFCSRNQQFSTGLLIWCAWLVSLPIPYFVLIS